MDVMTAQVDRVFPQAIEDLRRLVQIPSVAAQRRSIPDAAKAVRALLEGEGGRVTLLSDGGANPVVVAVFEGRSPRTLLFYQLDARTASVDLHSSFGAVIEGAATRLVWALATFKDPTGRVLIPGHYDRVRRPTAAEDAAIAQIPPDVIDGVRERVNVGKLIGGVRGADAVRQLLFTPTCTICGIWGGYTLEGSKTVLPAAAHAKVDFRLVPDQDPHEVARNVRRHLDAQGFRDIEVTVLGGEHPWRTSLGDPFVGLVRGVVTETTGRAALLYPTSAGTGPMNDVGPVLGIPLVSTGGGYWGSRAHAPDENVREGDFRETITLMARLLERFAG